jgi:hypothetical protein
MIHEFIMAILPVQGMQTFLRFRLTAEPGYPHNAEVAIEYDAMLPQSCEFGFSSSRLDHLNCGFT